MEISYKEKALTKIEHVGQTHKTNKHVLFCKYVYLSNVLLYRFPAVYPGILVTYYEKLMHGGTKKYTLSVGPFHIFDMGVSQTAELHVNQDTYMQIIWCCSIVLAL